MQLKLWKILVFFNTVLLSILKCAKFFLACDILITHKFILPPFLSLNDVSISQMATQSCHMLFLSWPEMIPSKSTWDRTNRDNFLSPVFFYGGPYVVI